MTHAGDVDRRDPADRRDPIDRRGLVVPREQVDRLAPIDRRALVDRHAVEVTGIEPASPLSVGNGELCFTVDVTGLQTLPDHYPVADATAGRPGTLLSTMAQWGWHSVPGDRGFDLAETRRTYQTPHGPVDYVDMAQPAGPHGPPGATPAQAWLRANPHRLDLARIGLAFAADPARNDQGQPPGLPRPIGADEITEPHQRLDLWSGLISSRLRLRGTEVKVITACHPRRDAVALSIRSGLLTAGLAVKISFPYGSAAWANAADWTRPGAHHSAVRLTDHGVRVTRTVDETRYGVQIMVGPASPACRATVLRVGAHDFLVTAYQAALDLVVEFTRDPEGGADGPEPLSVPQVLAASTGHWADFWSAGGAVDLSGSTDERAGELQRRIVLSQYLTAIHCAGSLPPQETGLMVNSWHGKSHLEMHWWHAAHFALWGRTEMLERGLRWYERILPAARATAAGQGYAGARWPKQVGPDGRESPSPISPFLIWQQPHPIHLAELVRRGADDPGAVLHRYADVVLATADFMASYPVPGPRGYQLGPPLVPAQESYAADKATVTNPTFELAYWAWGLRTATRWRAALGLPAEPLWEKVAAGLARPLIRDGRYAAIDVPPYTVLDDHPSMLYALGVVPPTDLIDPDVMAATLRHIREVWPWERTWGWDYPAMALTAVRLGDPHAAVDLLTMPVPKNTHLLNGHNHQNPQLPIYLPGNGGLLTAVAAMAAGCDADVAAGRSAPGFPSDGRWTVRHEGLRPLP